MPPGSVPERDDPWNFIEAVDMHLTERAGAVTRLVFWRGGGRRHGRHPLGPAQRSEWSWDGVHSSEPACPPPKAWRAILDEAAQARNALVHRGADPLQSHRLQELADVVSSLLRQFAYYRGEEWAGPTWKHSS